VGPTGGLYSVLNLKNATPARFQPVESIAPATTFMCVSSARCLLCYNGPDAEPTGWELGVTCPVFARYGDRHHEPGAESQAPSLKYKCGCCSTGAQQGPHLFNFHLNAGRTGEMGRRFQLYAARFL
jgi:hypothetical protein